MAVSLAPNESKTVAPHPLEPLSPEEIAAAVAIVRTSGKLGPKARFVTVALNPRSRRCWNTR